MYICLVNNIEKKILLSDFAKIQNGATCQDDWSTLFQGDGQMTATLNFKIWILYLLPTSDPCT